MDTNANLRTGLGANALNPSSSESTLIKAPAGSKPMIGGRKLDRPDKRFTTLDSQATRPAAAYGLNNSAAAIQNEGRDSATVHALGKLKTNPFS